MSGIDPTVPTFVPGLELGRRFYLEAVRPLLDRRFPGLVHSAALLGDGSEVLGFDTEMSMDHDWGPRVQIFVRGGDAGLAPEIVAMLGDHLPRVFGGFPVGVRRVERGTAVMDASVEGPLDHRVMATTVPDFARSVLGWDASRTAEAADWLTFPSQSLLALTAGAVYHDGTGELGALRERLAWYPRDVWLYLLACGWRRIAQEEHLMPRAGIVGDELGSALIGSRLVRDLISLCFLIERRYPPYPKWFGTAFGRLGCAPGLTPLLLRAQQARGWRERGAALCDACEAVAGMHNALGLTEELPARVSAFYDRPFRVIGGDRFAEALLAGVTDPAVRLVGERPLIGGIDQLSDSTDLKAGTDRLELLKPLYR